MESARGQGPQRIAVGFAGGLQSLLSNTIFAFSNATAKASGSARKASYLTFAKCRSGLLGLPKYVLSSGLNVNMKTLRYFQCAETLHMDFQGEL